MAVEVDTLFDGNNILVVHLKNSDGTSEAAVVKVDKSTFTGPDKDIEPGSLTVMEIQYQVDGYDQVELLWDHSTDVLIDVLKGQDVISYEFVGGKHDTGSGGTGDILLTTAGTGGSYDIQLRLKKKQ